MSCATLRTRIRAPRPGKHHVRLSISLSSGHVTQVARGLVVARSKFSEVEALPVFVDGQPSDIPPKSGVYAVFDSSGTLQYVGISRNINLSVAAHSKALDKAVVHSVKVGVIENATKDQLTEAWKEWLQEGVNEGGAVPPGNAGDAKQKQKWKGKGPTSKPEIKLTSGKGSDDLTCDIKDLIDMVVKNERIVAFVKGTRMQPQCGFSHQMLETLNAMKADYQVLNVLDEQFNPGLREGIKEFSSWPTIPQLYIAGEFVGGSDIVQEMAVNGELAKLVRGLN
jgi:Grx4 family monothiol glutaredoxin